MVKYTGRDGKEYILRFDMSAMEAMREKFGDIQESMKKMSMKDVEVIRDVFVIMAQAGAEYMAEKEGRVCKEQITGEGLLTKHSSIGRLNAMMKAIREAVADGNRMQSKDEEDDQIRDGYLAELEEQEKAKN
jgi:hypothetical protein